MARLERQEPFSFLNDNPMLGLKIVQRDYELLDGSNRLLVKQIHDGSIITRFEKTPLPVESANVVCPHFLELKWATGCPYSCAWCYLKGTLRFAPKKSRPSVKLYDKIEQHTRTFLKNVDGSGELLNTGELADSLMNEKNGYPFSKFIISLFQGQNVHKVLFVTKSNYIKNLLDINGQDRAVISFSLNADVVAKRFETGAPPVAERIEAASKLSKAGYEVRIRIDPMVPVENWQEHYLSLVDSIFSQFTPSRVTIGSLRGLQSTINMATDKSWVDYLSEKSNWGKRIDFNTRYLMYSAIIQYLKEKLDYSNVALCKETLGIWNKLGMDYRKIKCNCLL
jgi:spore photoproduct lyase